MIEIFPTSRCVREFYNSFSETNQLLPKAMSIAEFESKVLLVPNSSQADEDTRLLLMQEASEFETFKALKIEREFMSFLKNSTYLFKFFEELANEKVSINELRLADTYAEFDEHLDILELLLTRYTKLLKSKNLYDKIILKEIYEVNEDFLQSSSGFLLHLDGLLNRFEVELYEKASKVIPFKISLSINSFNTKLISTFAEIGFTLQEGKEYILNLSTKMIEKEKSLSNTKIQADVRGFSSRLLQSSYIHEKIGEFVEAGISPEEIVVILPDEKLAPFLKQFDRYKNLNFAMGESFCEETLYKKLDAIDKLLRIDEIEHKLRISRLQIEQSIIDKFQKNWRKKLNSEDILSCLTLFSKNEEYLASLTQKEKTALHIYEEELFRFSKLLKRVGSLELQKAHKLFLNRLSSKSIDDVMGGKITVMGLLESRGMSFKGVIVADFNDEFIPKRSKKDMFLSSSVRAHAKLPSREDRENLQRYYYHKLLSNAKHIAISYTQSEESMVSRFVDELGLYIKNDIDETSYMKPLFISHKVSSMFDPEFIEGSYDIKAAPLSASKLKTLLTCKRQFFYKYILKSHEAKMPLDEVQEVDIGNRLHDALFYVLKESKPINEDTLMIDLRRYLKTEAGSLEWHYHMDVWLERLRAICKTEAKRYEEGYRIHSLEKRYTAKYKGFILEGKIDRIDSKNEKLYVIDYKSGKIPLVTAKKLENWSEFQLEFYYLLAKEIAEVESLNYYELKTGKLISESMLEPKLAKLDEILQSLHEPITGFEKSEKTTPCGYCPYIKLCGRGS